MVSGNSERQLQTMGDGMNDDSASSGPGGAHDRKGQMPEYSDLEKLLHAVQRSNLHTSQIANRCGWLIAILLLVLLVLFFLPGRM